jgi:hypothetical protein
MYSTDLTQSHSFARDLFLISYSLILMNAALMGVATFDFVTQDPAVGHSLDLADTIFLSIFTVELGLQFIYYGWRLFFDAWLVFDLVIIVTSWALQGGQIARAFRILRALRLVTRIAVMRNLVTGTYECACTFVDRAFSTLRGLFG